MGKAPSKSSSNEIINLDEQEMAPGKQNKRAACPKEKLEFTFFQALLCHPGVVHRSWFLISYLSQPQYLQAIPLSDILGCAKWGKVILPFRRLLDVVACSDVTFIIMDCM